MSRGRAPWRVAWAGRSLDDLDKLDRSVACQVREAVNRLAETGQGDLTRLRPPEEGYRLRVRDWRVLLYLDEPPGVLVIRRVMHRSRAYGPR